MIRRARRVPALFAALVARGRPAPPPRWPRSPTRRRPSDPGDYTQYKVGDQTPERPDRQARVDVLGHARTTVAREHAATTRARSSSAACAAPTSWTPRTRPNTAWETTTGPPRRGDRRARLGHQVGRPQRDDRPAPQDAHQQGRGEGAQPRPRARRSSRCPARMTCAGLRRRLRRQRRRRLQRVRLRLRHPRGSTRSAPPTGVGPGDLLDPQDVLIAFTDGTDDDGNGFEDDMVGWDFLDDDNDPYDDVQYGHGTGEARDSTAEADNARARQRDRAGAARTACRSTCAWATPSWPT